MKRMTAISKNELIDKLDTRLKIKYDSLSKDIIRSSLHIYSVLGQERYATYALEIEEKMNQNSFKTILDWGAMYGHMTFLLRELKFDVLSIDIDHKGYTKDYTENSIILDIPILRTCDKVKLPYADNSFDAVLSMGVLEHVKDEEKSIEEVYRILKPGGLFFVYHLPNRYSWVEFIAKIINESDHPVKYTKQSLPQIFMNKKFEVIREPKYEYLLPQNYRVFSSGVRKIFNKIAPTIFKLDSLLLKTPLKIFSTSIGLILRKTRNQ